MLTKRLIPCLDVRAGKVTKGVKFRGNVDIGDPVEFARMYYEEGADELVFYDITASNERRGIMLEVVRAVAEAIYIPFSVGGGLRTLEDMRAVLLAGAEKVSVDSGAVRHPEIISQGARAFGSQCIVLSMQVQRAPMTEKIPSGWEICIDGGRTRTGLDALEWARRGEGLGAGELCVNSIDQDGTRAGYDIPLTRAMAEAVGIPVNVMDDLKHSTFIFPAIAMPPQSPYLIRYPIQFHLSTITIPSPSVPSALITPESVTSSTTALRAGRGREPSVVAMETITLLPSVRAR